MVYQLKDLRNIRMQVTITSFPELKPERDFSNFFRTFKRPEENLNENHFYSPFFAQGCVIAMDEHFGERKNAMETILEGLKDNIYSLVYIFYDFRFVPPNLEYHTEGEFLYTKKLLEKALQGTGLYLFFLTSHYNQLIGKTEQLKPEHYHIVLCKEDEKMNEYDYDRAINIFADNLRKNEIMNVKIDCE